MTIGMAIIKIENGKISFKLEKADLKEISIFLVARANLNL